MELTKKVLWVGLWVLAGLMVGTFCWGLWSVVARTSKPYDSWGPYYYIWMELYGSTRAWACHLLSVLFAAFVLAPVLRRRWLIILISMGLGLLAIRGIIGIERAGWMNHGAGSYWMWTVSGITRLWLLGVNPGEYLARLVLSWLLPMGIAWLTAHWRGGKSKREATRLPDGGGESARHTSA